MFWYIIWDNRYWSRCRARTRYASRLICFNCLKISSDCQFCYYFKKTPFFVAADMIWMHSYFVWKDGLLRPLLTTYWELLVMLLVEAASPSHLEYVPKFPRIPELAYLNNAAHASEWSWPESRLCEPVTMGKEYTLHIFTSIPPASMSCKAAYWWRKARAINASYVGLTTVYSLKTENVKIAVFSEPRGHP